MPKEKVSPGYLSYEEAKAIVATRLRSMVGNPPLSRRPVIIHGPKDGYCVVTLKFAEDNGFEVVG